MSKTTRFRIFGFFAILAVTSLMVWVLLPTTEAQEKIKFPEVSQEQTSAEIPIVDNTDEILLNAGKINVQVEKMKGGDAKEAAKVETLPGEQLHLIRFNGPIKSAWVESLKREGLTVVDYIPHYTYLVWGDSSAIQKVRSVSRNAASPIEWEGSYTPAHRIMPTVYRSEKNEQMGLRSDRFEVQLYKNEGANSETFRFLESFGRGEIVGRQEIKHYVNFVVGLDEEGLRQLSTRPDVISIHPYMEPTKFDEAQNLILRGNLTGNLPTPGDYLSYLLGKGFTQAQFDTSNFVVDVTDSGIGNADPANENQFVLRREGDPAQASRVVYSRLEGTPNTGSSRAGCDGHGNLNATIIGGYVPSGGIFTAGGAHADANGYRYGLGVAPFVKVGSSVIFDPDSYTSPNLPNLQSRAYADGARISSNSWGSASAGAYTSTAQAYDFLTRDAQPSGSAIPVAGNQEMVIIFAAGNDGPGPQSMGAPGTSKNLITVGASENVRAFGGSDRCGSSDASADSAHDMVGFSSRGPTTDGRRKPDIVLPGTHVTGGAAQNVAANPIAGTGTALTCLTANGTGVCGGVGSIFFPSAGQQWYTASSGTSHSTPAIAGMAALIRQHFINTAPIGGSPGSGTVPSPALTKALMMNTASYMDGDGANDSLPSNNQGMGLADLDNYFDVFAQDRILRDQQSADTFSDTGQERVFSGSVVDNTKPFRVTLAYSDAPGATSGNAFVNNLDLEVVVNGISYKGNSFLKGNSVAGGSADTRNNVESVFVPAGASGTFIVRVKATNIAGDGLPNNADTTDQDFALVVWNADEASVPVAVGGATAITAESCSINGAVDPAETVTVNFDLANVGIGPTTNLVATLLTTGGVSNPSAPQNYGALTSGGGAVTRAFTFTATTNCGENLVASLQLQDGSTNLGVVSFNFLTGALAAPTATSISTGNLTTGIPDAGTVQVPIEVNTSGALSDLNVKLRLNHTYVSDITATITSPGGITVPLIAGRGTSGDNMGSGANDCSGTFLVLDDSAATAISAGAPPFAGSFRPESPLSALNGQSIEGTWILTLSDAFDLDTGTLGCAQLEIQRQRYACCGVVGSPEVVSGGAPALVSESMLPPNNTPDPNETVTYNIAIANAGDGPTSNLVATLQNSGGVTPVTTSQSYGVINPASPAVVRPFTFVANGPCGGTVTATFQLQDGAVNHGTISYTFQLGTTQTTSQTFTNPAAITVPGSGSGASTGAPASVYPSTVTVSGAPSTITGASVTLSGFSHTWPGDVDVLLVSPTGRKFVMLSDAGGSAESAISNQNLTFVDSATAGLPSSWTSLPAGPYRSTNHTTGDLFPAPAPASPYLNAAPAGAETFATAFGGATGGDPNGTWSLYIVDDANFDSGSISGGWSLTLTTESQVCSTTPGPTEPERAVRGDFDGDGRTDISIWRPSTGEWWVSRSTGGYSGVQWGNSADIPLSADFSGDKDADFAVVRPSSASTFWLLNNPAFTAEALHWGNDQDIPLAGDYDGDGFADIAVYRPSVNVFYILIRGSGVVRSIPFGLPGDKPMAADFDGDGATDVAVYRPSDGTWHYADATDPVGQITSIQFGNATDIPVPADYDGDGSDNIAVYRPSIGVWFIIDSGVSSYSGWQWGNSTDIPVPGDYDGDGRYDLAVYRGGTWWILGSQDGPLSADWGNSTDVPIPWIHIRTTP